VHLCQAGSCTRARTLLLAISLRKLDELVREQTIKIVKIGRRTLVPHAELERFAKLNTAENLDGGPHGE
jgi:excisionase family DNA binding protein